MLAPLLMFGAVAVWVVAAPLGNVWYLRQARERALRDWDGLGAWEVREADRLGLRDLGMDGSVRIQARRVPRGKGWRGWDTDVVMPSPSEWPSNVELYGPAAISQIVGFRNRISIDDELDAVLLVRRTDSDSESQAQATLTDARLRRDLAQLFEEQPRLSLRDGQIAIERRGLPPRSVLERDIEAADRLHQRLSRT